MDSAYNFNLYIKDNRS